MAEWSVERFESWAGDIGKSTLQMTKIQFGKKRLTIQSYRAVLASLALAKTYDRVRLEAACQRALEIGSPTRTSVESILKKGLDKQPLESTRKAELQDDLFLQDHENVRGSDAFN